LIESVQSTLQTIVGVHPSLKGKKSMLTERKAPVIKHVGVKFKEIPYNGSFFHEQIYRKDPSPEVDDAWKALGIDCKESHFASELCANFVSDRAIRVPESEAEKSGIAADQVKITKEHGGGYPGNVEGLHHLHCLNLVRQSLYYNYDYYKTLGKGAFKNEEPIVKTHVSK
jgi:hypothetical protein